MALFGMSTSSSIATVINDGLPVPTAINANDIEQLMEEIAEKGPVPLEERLHSLNEVDKKIADLLSMVAEVLESLNKDKPLSKVKMEELYKRYEQKLSEIQHDIGEQLTYMEQVCVGAEHQGNSFQSHQLAEMSAMRLQLLYGQLKSFREVGRNLLRTRKDDQEATGVKIESGTTVASENTSDE